MPSPAGSAEPNAVGAAERPGRPAHATGPDVTDPPLRFSWRAAIGFAALCLLLNYPGRLNADSLFAVVAAGIPGQANNWHSATLGWLWNLPGGWLGQPAGALLVQAALFGAYAGFLPHVPATPRGRVTQVSELLFRVVLAGIAGFVGKDAVVLLALLVAIQLVRRGLHVGFGAGGVAALAVSILLFLLAKAPDFLVLVAAAALVLPFYARSRARYVALVGAAAILGTLAVPFNRVVDRELFGARDVHPDKQLVIFDLAALSLRTGHDLFADVPGWPANRLPPLARCALPYMWDAFAPWGPCRGYSAAYDRFDAALKWRWAAAIVAHPLAYARHRLTYAGYLLQSRDQAGWGTAGDPINDAASPQRHAELRGLMVGLHAPRPIALWHPRPWTPPVAALEAALFRFPKAQWTGLLAALAVLLASWMRRRRGVRLGAVLPAALAVGNVAMLMPFGVADPARYMLPTIGLAYAALLAMLAPGREQRRA